MKILFLCLLLSDPTNLVDALFGGCTCIKCECSECSCPSCECIFCPGRTYGQARAKAVAEKKDLIVAIGRRRFDLEKACPECIHVSVQKLEGATASPGVVIGKYRDGSLLWHAELTGLPQVEQVKNSITPTQRWSYVEPAYFVAPPSSRGC